MNLRDSLTVLSKSSPYAVTTSGEIVDPELRGIKSYLYVETEIERAFKGKLATTGPGEIIFLCGSSGDGKSEILTRYEQEYGDRVNFHFDATHSFEPELTAIDTLNQVFSKQKESNTPLVVGINIGMLANFEREGSSDHADIRKVISEFLENEEPQSQKLTFLDFEAYPKFSIEGARVSSRFFSSLINRIVIDDQGNRFRDQFNDELGKGASGDTNLVANYMLLRDKGVQKVLVELLLNARVRQDQFVTARMLLDFVYCILTGPKGLFDNLFNGGGNELLVALTGFDPCLRRDKELDLFMLQQSLKIDNPENESLLDELVSKFKIPPDLEVTSLVRLLFITRHSVLNSEFPINTTQVFSEPAETLYRDAWAAHKNYPEDPGAKKVIKKFYERVVFSAIQSYANRNAPYLSRDEFYLSSHGQLDLISEIELGVSYKLIEKEPCHDIHSFNLYIKWDGENLKPIPVNTNLVSLMVDVVSGYRPNKHDKNSVVLLDELVQHLTKKVCQSDTLYLFKNGERLAKLRNNRDGDIRVSGL